MLTTTDITDLITATPSKGRRGRMLAMQRQLNRDRNSSSAQRKLIAALLEQEPVASAVYSHPERAVRLDPVRAGKAITLTESDRAWLSRLPTADKVTFNDATELARLARQVEPRTPDARLIASIWEPVRTRHDRAAAARELDAARQPWPDIPRAALREALVDAVKAETSELDEAERRNRANVMLDAALTARAGRHTALVDGARNVLEDVENRRTERESLTAANEG